MSGLKAKIALKQDSQPRVWKARPVALARRPAVERELDKLGNEGVIKQVPYSEWAALIVTPVKKDGTVSVCRDFKVTVNSKLDVEAYPLPRIDEIFANLSEGQSL